MVGQVEGDCQNGRVQNEQDGVDGVNGGFLAVLHALVDLEEAGASEHEVGRDDVHEVRREAPRQPRSEAGEGKVHEAELLQGEAAGWALRGVFELFAVLLSLAEELFPQVIMSGGHALGLSPLVLQRHATRRRGHAGLEFVVQLLVLHAEDETES